MAFMKILTFDLQELNQEQYLRLAQKVFQNLNWQIKYLSIDSASAVVKSSSDPRGERFTILIKNNKLMMGSISIRAIVFDQGRNSENVKRFRDEFEKIRSEYDHVAFDQEPIKNYKAYDFDKSKILDFARVVSKYEKKNLIMGIFGGLLAGILGFMVWFFFVGVIIPMGYLLTGYIWVIFICPFLVGYGVGKSSNGQTMSFIIAGGVITLFFCIAGRFISLCLFIVYESHAVTWPILMETPVGNFFFIFRQCFLPEDIVWYLWALIWGLFTMNMIELSNRPQMEDIS